MIFRRLALMAVLAVTVTLGATAQRHNNEHPRREAHAQGGHHFSPEEFIQKLEAYVRKEANLTDEEAAAYFPVQKEMYKELRKINEAMRDLKKGVGENTSDEDASAFMDRLLELQQQECQVRATFYRKMCTQLSTQKVLQAIKAEDRFHREMLRPRRANGKERGRHRQ